MAGKQKSILKKGNYMAEVTKSDWKQFMAKVDLFGIAYNLRI